MGEVIRNLAEVKIGDSLCRLELNKPSWGGYRYGKFTYKTNIFVLAFPR